MWSTTGPSGWFIWFLEVVPAIVGALFLVAYSRKFPFTNLLYTLMAVHAVILMIGGHSTYAEVPLFNWLRDAFELERNYYDRVGHFAQGFVPAMILREILLRTSPLRAGKLLMFLITCATLGFSAFYELFEWWVAAATGEAADAFLGTQGDVWDTQWDMFMAMVGAILSQLMLARMHDKALKEAGFAQK